MLKKLSVFTVLLSVCTIFYSCDGPEDTKGGGKNPSTYRLTKGEAILLPGTSPNGLSSIKVELAATSGEMINATKEATSYVSFILVANLSDMQDEIIIPDGEYSYSNADPARETTLADSRDSKFIILSDNGIRNTYFIKGGSVIISKKGNAYVFEGKVKGSAEIDFSFTANLDMNVTNPAIIGDQASFTSAEITYDNKFVTNDIYSYAIKLKSDWGHELGLDLMSPMITDFRNIAAGEYTFSGVENVAEEFKVSNSANTYLKDGTTGAKYSVVDVEMNITHDVASTTIEGVVTLSTGKRVYFDYTGPISIEKARLSFNDFYIDLYGQHHTYTAYEQIYTMGAISSGLAGEEMALYVLSEINRYYDYFPIPDGKYEIVEETHVPSHIISTQTREHNGLYFKDKMNNKITYHFKDGYMDLKNGETTGGYKFEISGVTNVTEFVEEKEYGKVAGPDMEIEYSYTGVVSGPAFRYGHMHPYSTATRDRDFTNYFTDCIYWRAAQDGYWDFFGSTTDSGWLLLTLKGENGEWDEWLSLSTANPENYYMQIGLHIDPSTPRNVIPTGTFTIDDGWKFQYGTFMPGTYWGTWGNILQSTMIMNGNLTQMYPFGYGKDGGEITISKEGDIYTINVSGYDDQGPNGKKLTANYIGRILPEVMTKGNSSARANPMIKSKRVPVK